MKKIRCSIAVVLAVALLLTAGCGKSQNSENDDLVEKNTIPTETVTVTEPTKSSAPDTSLNSLRQAMAGTSQLFAVAYFGYHDIIDSDEPVDPFETMVDQAYWLCEDLPFLMDIPRDSVIGENGDLFCIVALDEDATVAVSKGYWDDENQQYIYDDILYSNSTGEPILLFCNNSGWEPDTQVYISGPSGEVFWYPQTDDNLCAYPLRNDNREDLFYDFSSYRELLMKRHRDMKDSEWVMPTYDFLVGTTWTWDGFLKDGREFLCSVTFEEDVLSVRWNDGYDTESHEYHDAAWELTYDEGFAILSVNFREMAGVLNYNLLYHEVYEQMYFAIDSVQENMPIGLEPLYRFMRPLEAPDPVDMAGLWEMVWTEVEGDRSEAEPATYFLEITTDYEGLYRISYIDNEHDDWSYYDKELVIFPFAMYDGCDNDQWVGAVNYTGKNGTGYDVTLLDYDTLLLQEEWTVDGAPMVGYRWFKRVGW